RDKLVTGVQTCALPISTAPKRLADFRAGVYMQTLLRDPAAGLMHSLIYFSFLILFAVTAVSQIQDQVPEGWKFLHGTTYQAYSRSEERRVGKEWIVWWS